MNVKVLQHPEVNNLTGWSTQQTWLQEQDGLFPRRIKISTRTAAWPENEVHLVIAARIAGVDNDGIRALVVRLHAQRATRYAELERMVKDIMTATLNDTSGAVAA